MTRIAMLAEHWRWSLWPGGFGGDDGPSNQLRR